MTAFKRGDRVRQIAFPDRPGTVLNDPTPTGWVEVHFDGGGGDIGNGIVDVPGEVLELVAGRPSLGWAPARVAGHGRLAGRPEAAAAKAEAMRRAVETRMEGVVSFCGACLCDWGTDRTDCSCECHRVTGLLAGVSTRTLALVLLLQVVLMAVVVGAWVYG